MKYQNKLKKIFKKDKNIVIGAIHLPPLLGYKDFPGFNIALKNAFKDIKALEVGGVDGIIIENNYDIPHKVLVDESIVCSLTYLCEKIRDFSNLPMGISVLWNDYRTALSIAKVLGLQFIRIPVFVDEVETSYGRIKGEPHEVINFKNLIRAKNIALLTDIHVKHARLISKNNLIKSARQAINNKTDAIIITGQWTGHAPDIDEIKLLRKSIKQFPILVGSGLNDKNIKSLFQFANGAIVSTSLKNGTKQSHKINIKSYKKRINQNKVRGLVKAL